MNKVEITVTYVGHEDYRDSFPPAVVIHAIKIQALKSFDLEASAADKYVLQFNGADLPENEHLSALNQNPVTLRLVLKEEVPKGVHE